VTVRPKMSKMAAIDHAGFGQLGNSEMSQVVDDSTWTFSLQVMEVAMPVSNPDANSVVGIGACKINCGGPQHSQIERTRHIQLTRSGGCGWLWYVSIIFHILPLPFFCDAAAGPACRAGWRLWRCHCALSRRSGGRCAKMRRTERTHQLRDAGGTDARATDAGRFGALGLVEGL
jgi:hypothetical protein